MLGRMGRTSPLGRKMCFSVCCLFLVYIYYWLVSICIGILGSDHGVLLALPLDRSIKIEHNSIYGALPLLLLLLTGKR